jgi:DNA-binding NtrC family response regulator
MNIEEGAGLTLLVIDDEEQNLGLIESALRQTGLDILTTTSPEIGFSLFQERRPEIVLLDLMMPSVSGMDLLEQIVAIDPRTEVILVTGYYSAESAVEAIKKGAADYLTKPLNVAALQVRVAKLIEENRRRLYITQLDQSLVDTFQLEGIVGRSPLVMEVFATLRRIAPHFRTVLLTGDTGTGKELAAHALHRLSPVADRTFAICNCSALVETLFESELFGYVRGAFTGATQDKIGLFEYAHQGIVFLDEIGDMPLAGPASRFTRASKSGRASHSRHQ